MTNPIDPTNPSNLPPDTHFCAYLQRRLCRNDAHCPHTDRIQAILGRPFTSKISTKQALADIVHDALTVADHCSLLGDYVPAHPRAPAHKPFQPCPRYVAL